METLQHIHKLIKDSSELAQVLNQVHTLQKLNSILQKHIKAPLNEHCIIANLKAEKIILHTDSSAWATYLRYELPTLLQAIKRYEEYLNVTEIIIKVRPNYAQNTKIMTQENGNLEREYKRHTNTIE